MKQSTKDFLLPCFIIMTCVGLILLLFFYINPKIDESIDYNILHDMIINNATFVNSLSCDDVKLRSNLINQINSPTQQDEVLQLREDFKRLLVEKNCK